MGRPPIPIKSRILEKIKKVAGPLEDECWIWQAGKDSDGYGKTWLNGRDARAHRASYEAFIGKIPKGLMLLHKCDNPSCVNPDHLFLGTCGDNKHDSVIKYRHNFGERSGRALLTNVQVEQICVMLNERKISQREIANIFGVQEQMISHIKHRRHWRLVSDRHLKVL